MDGNHVQNGEVQSTAAPTENQESEGVILGEEASEVILDVAELHCRDRPRAAVPLQSGGGDRVDVQFRACWDRKEGVGQSWVKPSQLQVRQRGS